MRQGRVLGNLRAGAARALDLRGSIFRHTRITSVDEIDERVNELFGDDDDESRVRHWESFLARRLGQNGVEMPSSELLQALNHLSKAASALSSHERRSVDKDRFIDIAIEQILEAEKATSSDWGGGEEEEE